MARVWIKPLHINKGKSIAQTLADRTDYAENPDKTNKGLYVTGYACDPRSADEEFLISKREYLYNTGRDQGSRNVLAYHICQSFKPGETDAATANEIGYKLALSFTKKAHSFIVATHTDRRHIHNHIVFNSTSLDCQRKFKDFKRSDLALRRISDLLCIEYGLSVITNPKPSKRQNYDDLFGKKEPTWREKLRRRIDEVLPSCASFEDFIAAMKALGYAVNDKRKYISMAAPGQKNPTRLDALKGEHTEAAIRERLGMARTVASTGAGGGHTRVSMLIDIQAKIQEGKGPGYEHWARIFNLKEAAKTLLFLKENGIDTYDDLAKKASSASGDFSALTKKIKAAETRMAEITELQKYIGTYGKTRDTYARYRKSGWNNDFYEEHRADITLHRAAKKHFDKLGLKKLPSIASLKQEYATLLAEKKKLYSGYRSSKSNMQELLIAKGNADRILGVKPDAQTHDVSRIQKRSDSHEL